MNDKDNRPAVAVPVQGPVGPAAATYFVAAEYQTPYSGLKKTSAVLTGCTFDPDDPEFLKMVTTTFAEAYGWPPSQVLLTCVSKLK